MADTVVEVVLGIDGLTATLELYAHGSDTLANSGGADTLNQRTNNKGTYFATVTEALAGNYIARVKDGSGNTLANGHILLADDTNTYQVYPSLVPDIAAATQSRVVALTQTLYQRWPMSSVMYGVQARTFDTHGAAVNADSTPTVAVTGQTSGDLSGNLSSASNPSTGVYLWTYTVASNATLEPIRFDISATIGGTAYSGSSLTQVVMFSTHSAIDARTEMDSNSVQLLAIRAVANAIPDGGALTDLLADIASILTAAGTDIPATLATIDGRLDTEIPAIVAALGTMQTDVTAILADTNEMQVDLVDGGRLDLIFDAILVDTAALDSRLTGVRAGYLDNLNVGGAVASQADINALNQSASRRILLATVNAYERPDSSSTSYTIEARTYDGDGAPVAADSSPTLAVTGANSGDLSANLSTISNPATGVYRWTYAVASDATLEPLLFEVSATLGGTAFPMSAHTQVTDAVAVDFTSADRTKLDALEARLTSGRADNLDNLDAAISTRLATSGYTAPLDATQTQSAAAAAIVAYDPPTRGEATSDTNSVLSAVSGVDGKADTIIGHTGTAIPAALSDLQDHGDAEWATSTFSITAEAIAAEVWTSEGRDVNVTEVAGVEVAGVDDFKATGFSTHSEADTRDAILNRVLAGNHTTSGTVGLLLQFLDAAISSRSSHAATAITGDGTTTQQLAATLTALGAALTTIGNAVDALPSAATVKTQVTDALRTDSGTELAATPAKNAPLGVQLQFLFQALRNAVSQADTGRQTIANDAGDVISEATATDDGTFTRSRYQDVA